MNNKFKTYFTVDRVEGCWAMLDSSLGTLKMPVSVFPQVREKRRFHIGSWSFCIMPGGIRESARTNSKACGFAFYRMILWQYLDNIRTYFNYSPQTRSFLRQKH
jgi:hypothetical protein